LQVPESPRKERDEGVLAQRAPRPGGPPHHFMQNPVSRKLSGIRLQPALRQADGKAAAGGLNEVRGLADSRWRDETWYDWRGVPQHD
jgi:hypothetical protein